jgi:hypothetical protein
MPQRMPFTYRQATHEAGSTGADRARRRRRRCAAAARGEEAAGPSGQAILSASDNRWQPAIQVLARVWVRVRVHFLITSAWLCRVKSFSKLAEVCKEVLRYIW